MNVLDHPDWLIKFTLLEFIFDRKYSLARARAKLVFYEQQWEVRENVISSEIQGLTTIFWNGTVIEESLQIFANNISG